VNDIYFITGGVKSGKSKLGMACTEALTQSPILLATARRTDDEMSVRIDKHIADRPNHWQSFESPLELPELIQKTQGALLVDCLGVWLTNILVEQPHTLEERVSTLINTLEARNEATVLISNESGLGVIGADALTRRFVDEVGLMNQAVARSAANVAITFSGLPLWLKGKAPF
jgi:adenosylcobinamide kinase/adenosylcobinamide-phosphate guanylyltransferase